MRLSELNAQFRPRERYVARVESANLQVNLSDDDKKILHEKRKEYFEKRRTALLDNISSRNNEMVKLQEQTENLKQELTKASQGMESMKEQYMRSLQLLEAELEAEKKEGSKRTDTIKSLRKQLDSRTGVSSRTRPVLK